MRLQNGLIAVATGSDPAKLDMEYRAARAQLSNRPDLKDKLPDFVKQNRDAAQFLGWVKYGFKTYQERRNVIWAGFRPLIDYLEAQDRSPGVAPITNALEAFDPENVHAVWQKALDRRADDPEGAITAARTLLETVCKHILDDAHKAYASDADLPKLWALASECLNLAPSQHQEEVFRAILGNCQSVVNYLGTIRNRIGDAHGQGRNPVKPKPRHAELAVNLAGTMASFLVATWQEQKTQLPV
jgi:hypothetical protein